MDYDVSISIGTTADMAGVKQVTQAVDDLGKAAGKLPSTLIPGGVGGTGAGVPAYAGTGAAGAAGPITWRLEGAEELTASIRRVDNTIDRTVQTVNKNTNWLTRSVDALNSLPGQLQSAGGGMGGGAGGGGMGGWGRFFGGLHVVGLGKLAWDLGWTLGEAINEAFGAKVKQLDAKVAASLQAAQDKLARWQDSLNAARAQHREDEFLKQEAAGIKQVNDAYAARLRTIDAIDRKATAGLELNQKLLQIENEKNRSIIRQRAIRGEITDSQARDELAKIDAKDSDQRMAMERKQAQQAAQTAQAKADAAEERVRQLMELRQSSTAKQAVKDMKPIQLYEQADALKRAQEDLAKWREFHQRQQTALKDQAWQDYEAAVAAQHEFMQGKGLDLNQTDQGNDQVLQKIVQQRQAALGATLDRINGTGLIGNLSGLSDDERINEYVRVLKLVSAAIAEDGAQMEAMIQEAEAAKQAAAEAADKVAATMQEHQAQSSATQEVTQETAATNAKQDAAAHAAVMASAAQAQLRKQVEDRRRQQTTDQEELTKAQETLAANMTNIKDWSEKSEGSSLQRPLSSMLDVFNKLSQKPQHTWNKDESKEYDKLTKWATNLNESSSLAGKSQQYQEMAASILRALQAWKQVIDKDSKLKKGEQEIRALEKEAQEVAGITTKAAELEKSALSLDDWLAKKRRQVDGLPGHARKNPIGALPAAEEEMKKILSESSPAGTGISAGELKMLTALKARLEKDDRRLEAADEFQQVIDLIGLLIGRYSASHTTQAQVTGELARLKKRIDLIESQAKFGRK